MNYKEFVEDWDKFKLADNILSLVFHDRLTDEQKIISLKMLLEPYKGESK